MKNINLPINSKIVLISVLLVLIIVSGLVGIFLYTLNSTLIHGTSRDQLTEIISEHEKLEEFYERNAGEEAHFVEIVNLAEERDFQIIIGQSLALMVPLVISWVGLIIFLIWRLVKLIKYYQTQKLEFVQDTTHEIRNPLAAISATLQNMQTDNNLAKTHKESVEKMYRQIMQLDGLTKDLLVLETTPSQKKNSKIDILDIISDVIEEQEDFAKSNGVKLNFNYDFSKDDEYEAIFVEFSSVEDFVILIRNLIKNSIFYADLLKSEPSVDIRIQKFAKSLGKNGVIIEIKDNGKGIPSEDLPQIKRRLSRSHASPILSNDSGTGLGLAIANKIIKDNTGQLKIDSEEGKGTTITLRI